MNPRAGSRRCVKIAKMPRSVLLERVSAYLLALITSACAAACAKSHAPASPERRLIITADVAPVGTLESSAPAAFAELSILPVGGSSERVTAALDANGRYDAALDAHHDEFLITVALPGVGATTLFYESDGEELQLRIHDPRPTAAEDDAIVVEGELVGVTPAHSVRAVGRGVPNGSADLGASGAFTLEIARQKSLSPHTIYFIERDPNEIELPRIVTIELGDEASVMEGLLIDFSEAAVPSADPYEADIGIAAGLLDCEYFAIGVLGAIVTAGDKESALAAGDAECSGEHRFWAQGWRFSEARWLAIPLGDPTDSRDPWLVGMLHLDQHSDKTLELPSLSRLELEREGNGSVRFSAALEGLDETAELYVQLSVRTPRGLEGWTIHTTRRRELEAHTDALRLNLGLFEDGMDIEDAVLIVRGGYEEASWSALTHQALRHHYFFGLRPL